MSIDPAPIAASELATVKVFFCDIPNAGDQFNSDLFLHYGHVARLVPPQESEVIGAGSILEWLPPYYTGAIIGGGFMTGQSGNTFNQGAVYAVRGELTRRRVCRNIDVLGDPGLLASYIYKRSTTECALGIIPHYGDAASPLIRNLVARNSKNAMVIDITQSPAAVIRQLTKCEAVVSSSLHGLVFADSFNIPSAWMCLSDNVIGAGFKFRDYYSLFGQRPHPLDPSYLYSVAAIVSQTRCRPNRPLDEIKYNLDGLFRKLPELVGEVRTRRNSHLRHAAMIIRNRCKAIKSEESLLSPAIQSSCRKSVPSVLRWLP